MSKLKICFKVQRHKNTDKNIGMTILVIGQLQYSTDKLKTIKSESH